MQTRIRFLIRTELRRQARRVRFSLRAVIQIRTNPVDFPFHINGDMSACMMAILGEMAAGQEVYSIDESFLDVSGIGRLIPLETFGQQMRERIRRETGLIIGVDFGATKTLAKLANHAAKKWTQTKGVVDLSSRTRQRKLLHLTDVSDIWGIGRRISLCLNQLGITTALQLADSNISMIRKKL
ncbi:Y-family DNA polymerase [Pantoea vagans]|uniref:Y-family DNA polymerase n=1 Tax=Pantoea vagans TaxID=470934 RepID=UPI001EE34FAF|nr:hypothetical protein [Pantoea vagans]